MLKVKLLYVSGVHEIHESLLYHDKISVLIGMSCRHIQAVVELGVFL